MHMNSIEQLIMWGEVAIELIYLLQRINDAIAFFWPLIATILVGLMIRIIMPGFIGHIAIIVIGIWVSGIYYDADRRWINANIYKE